MTAPLAPSEESDTVTPTLPDVAALDRDGEHGIPGMHRARHGVDTDGLQLLVLGSSRYVDAVEVYVRMITQGTGNGSTGVYIAPLEGSFGCRHLGVLLTFG